VVGVTWLDVGVPMPGETDAIYDHVVTIPLEDIVQIEYETTEATPLPG
jgi:hypothetical protein